MDLGMGVNGSGGWKGGLLRPSRSPYLSRTSMRKVLIQKKYRPMCEHVAFLPVGSTGSRASTTIAHSPTSHRTDGASLAVGRCGTAIEEFGSDRVSKYATERVMRFSPKVQ